MTKSDREPRLEERVRLLEHQLDYLRAELLHLVHEREKNVYSAAWLIFRPLRRLEAALVDAVTPLLRRLLGRAAAPAVETQLVEPPPTRDATTLDRTTPRRLLVDVTATARHDAGTGIQRVVKKITQALYRDDALPIPAVAVRCEGGRLLGCDAFVATLVAKLDLPVGPDREIEIEPGDRFFMLSDSWNAFEEFQPAFARIRAGGGEIVTCIFDLIPVLYPHACHEVTPPRYAAWLRRALVESDAFLAISRTVAEELADFVERTRLPHRPGLSIGWFHCGSDIVEGATAPPRPEVAAAAAGAMFLSVGTLEPRKGHRVALLAFEALWRAGRDARLVFVGRRGWFEEAITAEIRGHSEFGRRLFWFDDVGDAELAFLYDRSAAALVPSYAEGFGLPIAEAARRGRPVICSDIPVFREVGGAGALYFRVNDPQALADRIAELLDGRATADPSAVSRASWAEAAHRVAQVIATEDWSRRLP
jgi:glycosyltransferase involved in cell wall biosynthesis